MLLTAPPAPKPSEYTGFHTCGVLHEFGRCFPVSLVQKIRKVLYQIQENLLTSKAPRRGLALHLPRPASRRLPRNSSAGAPLSTCFRGLTTDSRRISAVGVHPEGAACAAFSAPVPRTKLQQARVVLDFRWPSSILDSQSAFRVLLLAGCEGSHAVVRERPFHLSCKSCLP